ncbi:hypothetical protein SKAU_G00150100 [Synaphobranchus kaupii]|uniref:Uncharacterized protein n=1 Tax=Synaphobranchus kaupii TaxID=118154 RepID=A0A9Q1FUC2_SYNKA|nr:hypothetical protein SKAU_G00150100 [Synaphobranchus kaupii]
MLHGYGDKRDPQTYLLVSKAVIALFVETIRSPQPICLATAGVCLAGKLLRNNNNNNNNKKKAGRSPCVRQGRRYLRLPHPLAPFSTTDSGPWLGVGHTPFLLVVGSMLPLQQRKKTAERGLSACESRHCLRPPHPLAVLQYH